MEEVARSGESPPTVSRPCWGPHNSCRSRDEVLTDSGSYTASAFGDGAWARLEERLSRVAEGCTRLVPGDAVLAGPRQWVRARPGRSESRARACSLRPSKTELEEVEKSEQTGNEYRA